METIRSDYLYNLNYYDFLFAKQPKNMINIAKIKDTPIELYLSAPARKNSSMAIEANKSKSPVPINQKKSLCLTTINNFNTIEHNLNKNLALHCLDNSLQSNKINYQKNIDSNNLVNPCSKKFMTLKQSYANYKKQNESDRLGVDILNNPNNSNNINNSNIPNIPNIINPKNEPFDLTEIKKKYKAGEGNDHLKKKKENLMQKVLTKKPEAKIDNKNNHLLSSIHLHGLHGLHGSNLQPLQPLHALQKVNFRNSSHNTDVFNTIQSKNIIIDEIKTMEIDIEEKLLDEELKKLISKNNRASIISSINSINGINGINSINPNSLTNPKINRKASMITPVLKPLDHIKDSDKNSKTMQRFNSMMINESSDFKLDAGENRKNQKNQKNQKNSSIVFLNDDEKLIIRRDRYKKIQLPTTNRESVLSLISYENSNQSITATCEKETTHRKRLFSENLNEKQIDKYDKDDKDDRDIIFSRSHKKMSTGIGTASIDSSNYVSQGNSSINKHRIPKIDLESLHSSMHSMLQINNSKINLNLTNNLSKNMKDSIIIDKESKDQFSQRNGNFKKNAKNSKNAKNLNSSPVSNQTPQATYIQKINEKFNLKYKQIIAKSKEKTSHHRFSELFSENQIDFIVKTKEQVELDNLKNEYLIKLNQFNLFENNKKIKNNLASYENTNKLDNTIAIANSNINTSSKFKNFYSSQKEFSNIGKVKNTLSNHSHHVSQLSNIPNLNNLNKTQNSSLFTTDENKNFTQTRISTFRLKVNQDKKHKKDKIKSKLIKALKKSDSSLLYENGNIDE